LFKNMIHANMRTFYMNDLCTAWDCSWSMIASGTYGLIVWWKALRWRVGGRLTSQYSSCDYVLG